MFLAHPTLPNSQGRKTRHDCRKFQNPLSSTLSRLPTLSTPTCPQSRGRFSFGNNIEEDDLNGEGAWSSSSSPKNSPPTFLYDPTSPIAYSLSRKGNLPRGGNFTISNYPAE